MKKISQFVSYSASILCLSFALSSFAEAGAKYEPEDGSIYLGYCASGYWSESELNQTLETIETEVSDKPFLLYSMFVHAKESGRWNGWNYRKDGPNGREVHGSGDYVKSIVAKGFTPVLSWTWMDWSDHSQSPTLQGLVRGEYDWYLDEWIEGIKSLEVPIFIRLSHEMDGYWYPYSEGFEAEPGRNTAEDYTAYWRYVVERFRAAGVDNVAWVWCVSGDSSGVRDWIDYYPGDQYVDWLGIDIYSNMDGGKALLEFREAIGSHKPIMIPEGGTEDLLTPYHPNYPGNSEWIREFYDTILNKMGNQVKAVCWFQWNDVSYVHRDPVQLEVYSDYINNSAFISELDMTNSSTDSSSLSDAFDVRVPNSVSVPADGSPVTLDAEIFGNIGKTGYKWTIEAGNTDGLLVEGSISNAILKGLKEGIYVVKFEAWDSQSHSSCHIEVVVGDLATSDIPSVRTSEEIWIGLNNDGKIVYADIHGLEDKIGGNWALETGDPSGLEIVDNLYAATIVGKKTGDYIVKAQFWDRLSHVSAFVSVHVGTGESDISTINPAIVAPDWVEIAADGFPYSLNTQYLGIEPSGGKWTVESGPGGGLTVIGSGERVELEATIAGEYVVKTQAWLGDIHVSSHIRVTVR